MDKKVKGFIFVMTLVLASFISYSCTKTDNPAGEATPNATLTHIAQFTATVTPTVTATSTPVCGMVMGYNGATAQSWPGGWYTAVRFTLDSEQTVNTFRITLGISDCGGGGGTAAMAIYGNSSNKPGSLIASDSEIVYTCGTEAFKTISPVVLPAGTYWMVAIASGAGVDGYSDAMHTGYQDSLFLDYGWANFISNGFPADGTTLSWATSFASWYNKHEAAYCAP